jgi:signal transduction histidine kinase
MLRIPSAGEVALGFAFNRAVDAARVAERLPTAMARHAAVALALVTTQLADERQLAELRARDAERTTFISTVAHELRTPLTGLGGYLGLILDGKVDDPAVERDFLERSRTIVGSMAELVDDLLELSALESGSVQLDLGPFSIAEAGSQVAAGLLPIAISRDISLTTGFPPRLRVATGDRRRVEQILTNLAANALKFTPSGGAVEIEGHVDGLVALFVVRDDGDGIPADERSRIFERFHRLANHERISGTGLGLPIARDLARQMSGDLEVASVPGSGSSFVLALPGPTEVDEATVAASLRRTLDGEEIALEERMVRRAIAVADEAAASRYPGSAAARRGGRLRALPPLRSEPATLA